MPFLYTFLFVLFYTLIPILFGSFKNKRLRLVLFYTYFGLLLYTANFINAAFFLPITPSSVARAGLFPFTASFLVAIMLSILERDAVVIRNLLVTIVFINVYIFLQFTFFSAILSDPTVLNSEYIQVEAFQFSTPLFISSTLLDVANLFLLILFLEKIKTRLSNIYFVYFVFTGVYLGILIFDGIFFALLYNLLRGKWVLQIGGEVLQKLIVGLIYSLSLLVFLLTHKNEVIEFTQEKYSFFLLRKKSKVELIDEIKRQQGALIDIESRTQNIESLGVLAGGVAHDFNNLLAVIAGSLSLTQEDLKDLRQSPDDIHIIDDMEELFQTMQDSVIKGKNLSDQLLMLAKIKKPLQERVDVIKLVDRAALLALSGGSISYDISIPFSECSWVLDTAQINQVLINLLLNAKQSMLSRGKITIHLFVGKIVNIPPEILKNPPKISKKTYLVIAIQDQGVGIPEKELTHIFEPYFTTKRHGKGLGLTICHSIVKNHEGIIYVESEVGVGTTMGVILPKRNLSRKYLTKQHVDQESISNLKILIMDDNVELLNTLSRILESLSHHVTKTPRGEECLEQFQIALNNNQPFDMVFLDLIIKDGLGGIETLKKLKQLSPNVKVIAISGFHDSDALRRPKKHGFITAIQKPFTKEQLDIVITNIIASASRKRK